MALMGEELQSNDKFQEFLAEIAKVPEFPALSRSMEEVMLKVDSEASIQHITNVILKDYSLTLRILRASNSALHHRGGARNQVDLAGRGAVGCRSGSRNGDQRGPAGAFPQALSRSARADSAFPAHGKPRERSRQAGGLSAQRRSLPLRHVPQSGRDPDRLLPSASVCRGFAAHAGGSDPRFPGLSGRTWVRLRQSRASRRAQLAYSGKRSRMHVGPDDPLAPRPDDRSRASGSDHALRP